MTTIPDLIRIYKNGFKQLVYYRPSQKGEKGKLSIIKIIILIAYISAYIFTFYQFFESNISEEAIDEFRNDGSYIQINSNLGIKDNWTISLWIRIDARGPGVFFSIPDSPEVPGVEYSVNGAKRFQIRNFNTSDDGVVLSGIKTVQENRWYCVAGTYDGRQVKLYINGTEEGSMNMTGVTRTNYNKTFIGSFSDLYNTGENATRGNIVEVRILDHALPATDISSDYNISKRNGVFPERAGTVAWYHLNKVLPISNIVKDTSPNGFDGIGYGVTALTKSDLWGEILYFEPYNIDQFFPFSIYGQVALLLNLTVLGGAIYFLIIGDRPLTVERIKSFKVNGFMGRIRDFSSRGRFHSLATIVMLLIILYTLLNLVVIVNEGFELFGVVNSICIAVYWTGKALAFVIWPVVAPALVLSALLVSLDIFAKDYPKLMKGFNFRLIFLFMVCLFVNLAVFGVISGVFKATIPNPQPSEYAKPISVEGLEGMYFYELGLWWTALGIVVVALIMVSLIAIEIIIGMRLGSNEIREKRKANLLFIYPFIFVYLVSKTIPYIVTFGPRLKTLNNLIDLFSLLLIIFFGIFRVLGLQGAPNEQNLKNKDKFTLKERVGMVPPYSKALFIFFLAFASFYISIEANLILTLFEVQNISRTVRMLMSVISLFSVIGFVFWRYQPFSKTTSLES